MVINAGHAEILSIVLFTIGLAGVLTRRNLIVIFVSVEIMLNAVNLNLVALSRKAAGGLSPVDGDTVALFVILLAACEVAVGLGILLGLYRKCGTLSVDEIEEMKE